MLLRRMLIFTFLSALLFSAVPAFALVVVDPGDNFPAPDGFYTLAYGLHSSASQFNGSDGEKAADADFTLDLLVLRPVVYFHAGDVPLAFQAIALAGKVEEKKFLDESSSGLGDFIFGPGVFLYSNQESNTHLSYWLYAYAPVGEYDKDKAINLGQGAWYFEHQLAFGKGAGDFLFDVNLNYYQYPFENGAKFKSPDRIQVDYSGAYKATGALTVGLNGGTYWDLSEATVDGDKVPDTKAHKIQLGPQVGYQISDRLSATLRWLRDWKAVNDFQGNDVWARLSYAF